MVSSRLKSLAVVFMLVLVVGLITVGCKKETKNTWVNTSSLPGQTFSQHNQSNANRSNSSIVYLGSDSKGRSSYDSFGPQDPSFEFRSLK